MLHTNVSVWHLLNIEGEVSIQKRSILPHRVANSLRRWRHTSILPRSPSCIDSCPSFAFRRYGGQYGHAHIAELVGDHKRVERGNQDCFGECRGGCVACVFNAGGEFFAFSRGLDVFFAIFIFHR